MIRRAIFAACSAAFLLLAADARADLANAPMVNMADEAALCGSFFGVVAQCIAATPTERTAQLAKQYEKVSSNAFLMALQYGDRAGMKQEAFIAKAKMYGRMMWDKIGNNCSNIAIINAEYLEVCGAVMRRPEDRLKYWIRFLAPR
jgi:hypothetical protein